MKSDTELQKAFKMEREGDNTIHHYFFPAQENTWTEEESLRCIELQIEAADNILAEYPDRGFYMILNILDQRRYDVSQKGLDKYAEALKRQNIVKVAVICEPRYMVSMTHSFLVIPNPFFREEQIMHFFENLEQAREWIAVQNASIE